MKEKSTIKTCLEEMEQRLNIEKGKNEGALVKKV
jgi:hypothetical protein